MENNFDVYEGLHLFNDAMYKATLYLEAIGKAGVFEQGQVERCVASIRQVRSATNLYLIGVIQQVEAQNSESGAPPLPQ